MRFKSLVSPLAIAIGLGLAGGAVAQDAAAEFTIEDGSLMINGAAITPEQADYVQNYCNDLQAEFEDEAAGEGGGGASTEPMEDDAADDADADASADESADDNDDEPSLEDLPTSMIDFDLSQLTRDDCIEAGFITE